jgi:hypothetical protein
MKIRFKTTKTEDIPLEILKPFPYPPKNLTIGSEYVVYAVSEFHNNIWYYVDVDHNSSDCEWIPEIFFELIDHRLSRYWVFLIKKDLPKNRFFLGYSEWANDSYLGKNLVEDEENNEIEIFRAYKERMDLEFPDSSITESAEIMDEEWLMCRKCIDAWQSTDTLDALIKCPMCQTIYNNPRYKNELPHCPHTADNLT